ncbi:amidohydrolase family protein [Aurantimicrobium minutum]|uniref:amidohydrolase family protein n=1 Tax=Aurantimicrobium minutum TaxID=708131 RepID=UPI0024739AB2|nr:amidohydrolase family protein [Aurantimicrobium minutum]MDH6422282.1 putative TIM-barrel fold metal-dependent hydrolase [Aurantimicrobium minutum]
MNPHAIDVHAHYWTDDYLDLIKDLGKTDTDTQRGQGAGGGPELSARLDLMDRTGVQVQVLSTSPQMPYGSNAIKAVAAAQFVNDQYAAVVAAHPTRFRAFASLPLPHIEQSLDELDRALSLPGFVGVATTTTVQGIPFTDEKFSPIWAELNRRGTVLYVHPAGESVQSLLIKDAPMTWMVGAPVEDTVSIVDMIINGIPSLYPNIKIINSHLGGALPMLMQRLDNQYQWEAPSTPYRPSLEAKKMWYDTVGHGHVPALQAADATFGSSRLLFGTDFPYESGPIFKRAVDYVQESGLDEVTVEEIYRGNAEKVFDPKDWNL